MNAKELQAEIESCLLRGSKLLFDAPEWRAHCESWVIDKHTLLVRNFCRERAANLAQALADRIISEEEAERRVDTHELLFGKAGR